MGIEKLQTPQVPQKQAGIQIREGMTVEEVKKYGSEGQKLAANLFDADMVKNAKGDWIRDGIFTKSEAEYFNQFDFSVKNNVFTMYDRVTDQTTEIKYDNIEDLKSLLNDKWNEVGHLALSQNGKIKYYMADMTHGGKMTLDLTKGTITYDKVQGYGVFAVGEKVTVKNSDVELISSNAGELEIQNTKDKRRILPDRATVVATDKKTLLKVDDQSNVKIERDNKK